jgi:hypothetical protein
VPSEKDIQRLAEINSFTLEQNYFHGEVGIQINALMAGAAWNLKKMIENLIKKNAHFIFRLFFFEKFLQHNCVNRDC